METPPLGDEPGEIVSGLGFIRCVDTTPVEIVALRRSGGLVLETVAPSGLELGRRDVADGPEDALRVPPVDPGQRCKLDVFDGAPGSLGLVVNELGLVEADDRL